MKLKVSLFFFILTFYIASVFGQPTNDNCQSAIHIPSIDEYCSSPGQFSNINATAAVVPALGCLFTPESEVWFTFIPNAPAINIQVFGNVNNQGTMGSPFVAVFEGGCSNLMEVGCTSAGTNENVIELTVGDLVIGQVYYIAVDGEVGQNGTFQLCIDEFLPPPSPESDCDKAVVLCDKSSFFVETVIGIGDDVNEVDLASCIPDEDASVWYKWTCDIAGTLTFTLTPNNYVPGFISDDLDFILYELPNGITDCTGKILQRCMGSGANTGPNGTPLPLQEWPTCNGPTGLMVGDPDLTEAPGCTGANDNNFAAPLDMETGKSYALLVNNFSQSGLGFSIDFGGTGTFLGPFPDFNVEAVEAFECDKTIIFTNLSNSTTDSIVSYSWNFGAGATPIFANTTGPHNVIYESFGAKKVALTVESSRGCIVTEILDIDVAACCADTSTLEVVAEAMDQICPGSNTGIITGMGISGAPEYMFSLDGINFQPSSTFPSLPPGEFMLFIQDQKGCTNQIDVMVDSANIFAVNVPDTIFVDLGETAEIIAVTDPPILPTNVTWNPSGSLTFPGMSIAALLNPTSLPPGTTTYSVTISNDDGCVASDQVVLFVNIVRPLFIPNVISANGDDVNDRVIVFGTNAAAEVEVMRIFDRWGALVYEASNFALNDPGIGWDGVYKGIIVNPGVFSYHARVRFVDNVSLNYTGTITVVR